MSNQKTERFPEALDRCDGDRELLAAMAEVVADDAPRVLQRILSDLAASAYERFADDAHALKGMLVSFETGVAIAQLEQVIIAARQGAHEEAAVLFKTQRAELDKLIHDISQVAQGIH